MNANPVNIFGVKITPVSYTGLTEKIEEAVQSGKGLFLTYATANTLNEAYKSAVYRDVLNSFDLIHADGAGTRLGLRLLGKTGSFPERITGSDFYPLLADFCIVHKYSIYIFGDTKNTCLAVQEKIGSAIISGWSEGYNYQTEKVIEEIQNTNPKIILVGLGAPRQETWAAENRAALEGRVVICVGEGLRVLAETKRRGPLWMQKAGLEWLVRLVNEPRRLWKRYLIGNFLFIYRIVRQKFSGTYGT